MRIASFYLTAVAPAFLFLAVPPAFAGTAFTSFENEVAVGGDYNDPNPVEDHDLINLPGEPLVDSTQDSVDAGDLGFDASFLAIDATSGLVDGDEVGVSNNTSLVGGAFSDGSQGYLFNDTDGVMVLKFDPVDISDHTNLELDYFLYDTSYEATDSFRIFLNVDDSTEVDILDSTGIDLNDLGVQGTWQTLTKDLGGLGSLAVLTIHASFTSNNEGMVIDNIRFSAVPEPGCFALATVAGIALVGVARRRK